MSRVISEIDERVVDWINGAVVGDCSSIALSGQLIPDRISTWNENLLYFVSDLDKGDRNSLNTILLKMNIILSLFYDVIKE